MLRLTVLGCGTSSGVPRIGNDWGACDPAEPRNRRRRASVLVESATTRILVDSSPDLREQLLDAQCDHVDAVLWTHDHADHCHGIDDLRQLAQAMGRPVRGLACIQTLNALKERFAYAFAGRPNYPAILHGDVMPSGPFVVGDIAIATVEQPHGHIWSTGFRFDCGGRTIGYATDFHAFTDDMTDFYAGVDLWVVDALRERVHPTHVNLDQTLASIAQVRPKRAVLTHMDHSMDYAALSARLPAGVEPGYDGMTIVLEPAQPTAS